MITVEKIHETITIDRPICANYTIDAWEFHKDVKYMEIQKAGEKKETQPIQRQEKPLDTAKEKTQAEKSAKLRFIEDIQIRAAKIKTPSKVESTTAITQQEEDKENTPAGATQNNKGVIHDRKSCNPPLGGIMQPEATPTTSTKSPEVSPPMLVTAHDKTVEIKTISRKRCLEKQGRETLEEKSPSSGENNDSDTGHRERDIVSTVESGRKMCTCEKLTLVRDRCMFRTREAPRGA